MINKEMLQYKLEREAIKQNGGICESYAYCRFCKEPKSFNRKSPIPCAEALLDLRDINDMLKKYMSNKMKITTMKERIKRWEEGIGKEEFIDVPVSNFGMPRAKNRISSPVENQVIYQEMNERQVREMIRREKSKLSVLEQEVRKLDIAFECLSSAEMFLLECRYFLNLSWHDIENNFNQEFHTEVTEKRLKNRITSIKKKLLDIIRVQ